MLIKNLAIKTLISATVVLLAGLLAAISSLAIMGMSGINSAYVDTFMSKRSVVNIGNSELYITREQLALDRAILYKGTDEEKEFVRAATSMEKLSEMWWKRYFDQPRGKDEDLLAQAVVAKRTVFFEAADALVQAIASHEQAHLLEGARRVQAAYKDLESADDQVRQFQFGGAKERFDGVQARFNTFQIVIYVALAVGLLIAFISYLTLTNAISRPIDGVLAHFSTMASGDLSELIEVRWTNEVGRLLEGAAKMQRSLTNTVRSVRTSSETIATASRQIAAGNTDLSARTEEQASALQETASSMEQLADNVKRNADNARQASALTANATEIAHRGNTVVAQVVGTMGDISQSSAKIADIISIIEGIAFQTNILALNAAVEAARAGDEGRGFAVVAGEVRSLAQRAGGAAKEIKELINASSVRVQSGSMLVEKAGQTMTDILLAVQRVSDIFSEISTASEEQSDRIDEVSRAVTQMNEVTQQNAALVEEAAAGAQSLDALAQSLRNVVAVFRLAE